MGVIQQFVFICKKCNVEKKQPKVNLTWMPNRIVILTCINCGLVEVVKCDMKVTETKEQFDEKLIKTIVRLKRNLIN